MNFFGPPSLCNCRFIYSEGFGDWGLLKDAQKLWITLLELGRKQTNTSDMIQLAFGLGTNLDMDKL